MKNYTARVKMMDETVQVFTCDTDDILNVEVIAMESLYAAGKHPSHIEMVWVTAPMKEPYFVAAKGPDNFVIYDEAVWDGSATYKGRFSGKTLEEMRAEEKYEGVQLMEWDDAYPLYEAAQVAKYVGPVKEIDRERFDYLLEVLPPRDWQHDAVAESFKLCERLTGNITTIAARIGQQCYEFNDNINMTHQAIVEKIGKAVADGTLVKM